MQRILPCLHDIVADDMEPGDMEPALRLVRLTCSLRAVLGIEVLTEEHFEYGEELVTELREIIPVESSAQCSMYILTLVLR